MTIFLFKLLVRVMSMNVRSYIFTANLFRNGVVLDYVSYSFGKKLHLECTVKALEGRNSSFFW